MGYSLAWLAVRGIPYDAALERLGLHKSEEHADYAERELTGRPISDGWSLVVARGCDHRIIGEQPLASLSTGCEVVACSVEEHVMYSSAELWSHSQRIWRVEHDAQEAIDHLASQGDLPADFNAIRDRFVEQRGAEGGKDAEVDFYFEIPLVLAQVRVGFKHDETNASESQGKFQVLSDPSISDGKAWWRFWK